MPPIESKSKLLPFAGHGFTWLAFEEFFCDFLAAGPVLSRPNGATNKVHTARRFGRQGDSQPGIDILATMEDGEVWAFQCKHYTTTRFGPEQARQAIKKCTFAATRKFLLITREVSEECQSVVAGHPDWEIWDSRDITREFLKCLPDKTEASQILYRHFGPGWPEQFFDLPGRIPLQGTEAAFQKYLIPDQSFHHSLPFVGRKKWLKQLRTFATAKRARVLLLKGPGGIGKSRLLLEWGRLQRTLTPDTTIRHVSDAPAAAADYARAIDLSPKPLILVLDDAHRLNDVRQALFPLVAERADVKLLLSFRPGPSAQVRSELIEAGFDTNHILETESVPPLSSTNHLKLAEAALGTELASQYRRHVSECSRDCPLIAVLAAGLIKSGELTQQNFQDTEAFKDHVLRKGFDRDLGRVSAELGLKLPLTREFAQLIALLSPVNLDAAFLTQASELLGIKAHQISDLAEAFRDAGLLCATGAGERIVPDLLSDHLAYSACYDKSGRDRLFVVEVLEHFSPEQFPPIFQHVAEAEWRATQSSKQADSVIEPLWQWFAERFESSPFHERAAQLNQWSNISHLQARRTLDLARLALVTTTAPDANPADFLSRDDFEDENPSGSKETTASAKLDSQADVILAIPRLLKPLANTHPAHTGRCLDILLQICNRPDFDTGDWRLERDPISMIGEIGSFEVWKSPEVSEAVMAWMESRLLTADTLARRRESRRLVGAVLTPYFKTDVEESWQAGMTIHFQAHLVSIPKTVALRDRARAMCQRIAGWQNTELTLGVIDVLTQATAPAELRFSSRVPAAYEREWENERTKALPTLNEIVSANTEPLVLFEARKTLLHRLRYDDSDDFKDRCRPVYESIPDSPELRLIRAILGYHDEEFGRPSKGEDTSAWHALMERRWHDFLNAVASELKAGIATPAGMLARVEGLSVHLKRFGYTPNWRPLASALSDTEPAFALAVANETIQQPHERLAELLDNLIYYATKQDLGARLDLLRQAVKSGHFGLIAGAVGLLTWWRQDDDAFPDEAWNLVLEAAAKPAQNVTRSILHFIWLNRQTLDARDWQLLTKLPVLDSESLAEQLLQRIAQLIERHPLKPTPTLIAAVLAKLDEVKTIRKRDTESHLSRLAKDFPAQVFLFLWRRIQRCKAEGRPTFQPLPLESIPFNTLIDDPAVARVLDSLETRILSRESLNYDEKRLLANLLLGGNGEPRFLGLIDGVSTPSQLDCVTALMNASFDRSASLASPSIVRALLIKARSFGPPIYKATFAKLTTLHGARGGTNGEPDPEWQGLLASVEKRAHQFADDPVLGPLYSEAVKRERAHMEALRQDFRRNPPR